MKKLLLIGIAALALTGCTPKKAEVTPTPTPEVTTQTPSSAPVVEMSSPIQSPGAKDPAMAVNVKAQAPNPNAMAVATIETQDFAFTPATLKVKPGQTVKFTNRDAIKHNVHAVDDSFKTELMGKNESATFVAPTKPGSYNFVCDPHAKMMKGVLIVE